jgi:Zn-dependent peptidase ImmA (M78 family)/transcriptional regulator with XRE-family HTH domain
VIGQRIAHAREYCGLTQQQLAELSGISQPAISQAIMSGHASEQTLEAIAKATGFGVAFFTRGPLPDLPNGSIKHRKHASTTQKSEKRLRAHIRHVIETLEELDHTNVKLPTVRIKALEHAVTDEGIETAANDMRETIGVGPSDPIPNLTRAIERAGVIVVGSAVPIDEKHYGASYWPDHPIGRPIICFGRGMTGDRTRLTIGHELGHLVLHQYGTHETKVAETQAFLFGAALLVPADALKEFLDGTPITLHALVQVKAHFGISIRALIKRCFDLRLIDSDKRLSMEKQLSARGWQTNEPVEVPTETPRLLAQSIELAYPNKQGISAAYPIPQLARRELVA